MTPTLTDRLAAFLATARCPGVTVTLEDDQVHVEGGTIVDLAYLTALCNAARIHLEDTSDPALFIDEGWHVYFEVPRE